MDEIHGLRDKYRPTSPFSSSTIHKGCGLSTRVYASEDDAFSVVHHGCAAATYSLAHEIGHLIGARHDLNMDDSKTPFPYGHGYVNGTKWRDIMSYKESCGGCTRLPVWSGPKVIVNGEPAGSDGPRQFARHHGAGRAGRGLQVRSGRPVGGGSLRPTLQLRSTMRSSFLLRIHERPRNATSIARPRPDEASLMTFSETWPKA